MPRFEGATYFDLKGGLNTESSPLNIPASDAVALSNIDLNSDGSISRRRALDFMGPSSSGALYQDSTITDYAGLADVPSYIQFSPSNSTTDYVVVNVGNLLHFYDYSSPENLMEINAPEQTLQLSSTLQTANINTELLQVKNDVVVLNKERVFTLIKYDPALTTGSRFSIAGAEELVLWVRTTVQIPETPATTIPNPAYPHPDDIEPATLPVASVPASDVSNLVALEGTFTTGLSSGSRLWLGGSSDNPSTLYFSQTLVNGDEYARFYQYADPTDVSDNQLVDTDGGSINITEASSIISLASLGGGIIVFTTSGIWSISGQDGFRPTSYTINKLSDVVIAGSNTWTSVGDSLAVFAKDGVYKITAKSALEAPEVSLLSAKITEAYQSVPDYSKTSGRAVYNAATYRLYFWTNFTTYQWQKAFNPNNQSTLLRDAFVLNTQTGSWTQYRLPTDEVGTKVGLSDFAVLDGGAIIQSNVVDSLGNQVVDSLGNFVVTQSLADISVSEVLTGLVLKQSGTTWKFSLVEFDTAGVIDFVSSTDGDSSSPASSITLAHQLFKDIAHTKFAPYLIPIFERIESGVLDAGGVDLTPGGCKYRVDWDWSINSNSKKFGTLRDAYFPYRYTTSRFGGGDNGRELVTSKLKIRGQGDVLRLHFESDGDKDFKLLGWQLLLHAKGTV